MQKKIMIVCMYVCILGRSIKGASNTAFPCSSAGNNGQGFAVYSMHTGKIALALPRVVSSPMYYIQFYIVIVSISSVRSC